MTDQSPRLEPLEPYPRPDIPVSKRSIWQQLVPGRRVRWGTSSALVVTLVIASLLIAVLFLPRWLVGAPSGLQHLSLSQRVQSEISLAQTRNSVRTTLIQAVGGALVLLTFAVGLGQLLVAREGQLVDRFTRSVDQLGNDKVDVRLGGIFALQQLAARPEYAQPVAEILIAYLKTHSRVLDQEQEVGSQQSASKSKLDATSVVGADRETGARVRLRPDLQAALRILVRDGLWKRVSASALDLSFVRVPYADLPGLDFSGIVLLGAVLDGSNLRQAHFRNADLRQASFVRVDLLDADFEGADLSNADLSQARLDNAILRNAILEGTLFRDRASLMRADLADADATNADFSQAILISAKFRGAALDGAHFEDANLSGADLRDVKGIEHADFKRATLTNAQKDRSMTTGAGGSPGSG